MRCRLHANRNPADLTGGDRLIDVASAPALSRNSSDGSVPVYARRCLESGTLPRCFSTMVKRAPSYVRPDRRTRQAAIPLPDRSIFSHGGGASDFLRADALSGRHLFFHNMFHGRCPCAQVRHPGTGVNLSIRHPAHAPDVQCFTDLDEQKSPPRAKVLNRILHLESERKRESENLIML
jgi:hypothetical protein